ncbi:GNAT family N-acetyltransferase [Rhodovulum sp. DZ06]|uniref:GNAT family N-acetyltransferase n=1 Tax=Rhodovulum sp. DZ06 TaxID=3425126 RepID=UPI003D347D9F
MTVHMRPFRPADIPAGKALSDAENWPPRIADWEFHLARSEGVALEEDGRVLACTLTTPLGPDVGGISNVLVDRAARGRGLGRRAVEGAMELAAGRELRLWATAEGRPLYEKLGFAAEGEVLQLQGVLARAPRAPVLGAVGLGPDALAEICALDRRHFQADRRQTIAAFLANPEAEAIGVRGPDGLTAWAARRPFGFGEEIGPVIAGDAETAAALVAKLMQGRAGRYLRVDADGDGAFAAAVQGFGLPCMSRVTFMRRGARTPRPTVFGLSDQGIG